MHLDIKNLHHPATEKCTEPNGNCMEALKENCLVLHETKYSFIVPLSWIQLSCSRNIKKLLVPLAKAEVTPSSNVS